MHKSTILRYFRIFNRIFIFLDNKNVLHNYITKKILINLFSTKIIEMVERFIQFINI